MIFLDRRFQRDDSATAAAFVVSLRSLSNYNSYHSIVRLAKLYFYIYLTLTGCLVRTVTAYDNNNAAPNDYDDQTTSTSRRSTIIVDDESSEFRHYYGATSTLFTPCTFPVPSDAESWRKCDVEQNKRTKYNVCAPESTLLLSEGFALYKKMDEIHHAHGEACVCQSDKTTPSCWYQFAFAFVEELTLPQHPLPQSIRANELCNSSSHKSARLPKTPEATNTNNFWWYNRSMVDSYGKKFAEILAERWNIGVCKEGILILVVKKGPVAVIYSHLGELVAHNTAHLTAPDNYDVKAMDEALARVNAILQNNSTLEKALVHLISLYEELLTLADQTYSDFNSGNKSASAFKNHVPNWALGVFGACGGLLLIMALGLGMVRTRARRVTVRNKQNGDQSRRWKAAGFVGGMFKRGGDGAAGSGGNSGYADNEKPVVKKSQTKLLPMKILSRTKTTSGGGNESSGH